MAFFVLFEFSQFACLHACAEWSLNTAHASRSQLNFCCLPTSQTATSSTGVCPRASYLYRLTGTDTVVVYRTTNGATCKTGYRCQVPGLGYEPGIF
jgi:hypothetical protein